MLHTFSASFGLVISSMDSVCTGRRAGQVVEVVTGRGSLYYADGWKKSATLLNFDSLLARETVGCVSEDINILAKLLGFSPATLARRIDRAPIDR